MALPSEGQLYSLLGQTTSSEYKRRQQEERDFKRSLRRDQMKAMLLQPLIGAAATTGMQAITDVLGDRFLSDKGQNFLNTEQGRTLGTQLRSIDQQKKQIQSELDFYNTPDASTKMADIIYKEQIAKLGKLTDVEQGQVKSLIYEDKDLITNELNAYRTALKNQLKLLDTAPSPEQIASRLKDTRFYYGKNKLQKLFSTGFNKLLGKDMEEIKQKSRNFLITGSEDPEYKSLIFEFMNDSKAFRALEDASDQIITGDETFVKNFIEKIKTDSDSRELYEAIQARKGQDADKALAGHAFFLGLRQKISKSQQQAEKTNTVNPLAETLVYKAYTAPEAKTFIENNDVAGFKNFVLKNYFQGPNKDQTFEDFKKSSIANSLIINQAEEKLGGLLNDINPDIAAKTTGEVKYMDRLVEGAFLDAEKAIYRLGYESPELGNFTTTEVRQGIRRYVAARLTDPAVNEDNEYRPVTLKELTNEENAQLLKDSIASVRKDSQLSEQNKEFQKRAFDDIKSKIDEILANVDNDPTIDEVQKHTIASDRLKTYVDNFAAQNFSAEYEDIFNNEITRVQGLIDNKFIARPTPGRKSDRDRGPDDFNLDRYLKDRFTVFGKGDRTRRRSPIVERRERSLLENPNAEITIPSSVEGKVSYVGKIFEDDPHEILFMKRLVNQESLFGKAPGTYDLTGDVGKRGSYGVAQVDEVAFDAVKDKLANPYSTIHKYIEPFKKATGRDLTTVKYEDLKDDVLSIAFGRMYLMQLTGNPIPADIQGQSKYWKTYYNTKAGKGTAEEFLNTNKNL